ncbi:hypothetical protein B0H16DRAFT_648757 [Mycena metata]|uniref:Uncharacterized protein n=1 Tax=Mycena metata TaxID=1033252 RepID=A0AAD7MBB9_9AGAR|nr:hypothetical protein B0H16DRAFT_648757 [Mycena metata]
MYGFSGTYPASSLISRESTLTCFFPSLIPIPSTPALPFSRQRRPESFAPSKSSKTLRSKLGQFSNPQFWLTRIQVPQIIWFVIGDCIRICRYHRSAGRGVGAEKGRGGKRRRWRSWASIRRVCAGRNSGHARMYVGARGPDTHNERVATSAHTHGVCAERGHVVRRCTRGRTRGTATATATQCDKTGRGNGEGNGRGTRGEDGDGDMGRQEVAVSACALYGDSKRMVSPHAHGSSTPTRRAAAVGRGGGVGIGAPARDVGVQRVGGRDDGAGRRTGRGRWAKVRPFFMFSVGTSPR